MARGTLVPRGCLLAASGRTACPAMAWRALPRLTDEPTASGQAAQARGGKHSLGKNKRSRKPRPARRDEFKGPSLRTGCIGELA